MVLTLARSHRPLAARSGPRAKTFGNATWPIDTSPPLHGLSGPPEKPSGIVGEAAGALTGVGLDAVFITGQTY